MLKADGIIFHETGKSYSISYLSPRKWRVSSPHTATLNTHSSISYVERLRVEFSQHGEEVTFPGAGDPSELLKLYYRTERRKPYDVMEIFQNWFVVTIAEIFKITEIL